jgi:hypothetical protein
MFDLTTIKSLVDKTITQISGRELVSSSEMTDLLLDIRLYLITQDEQATTQNESTVSK